MRYLPINFLLLFIAVTRASAQLNDSLQRLISSEKVEESLKTEASGLCFECFEFTLVPNKSSDANTRTITYIYEGHSFGLDLRIKNDSLFEFHAMHGGGGNCISLGKCEWQNDSTIILNWDKKRTFIRWWNMSSKSQTHNVLPFAVVNWKFIVRKNKLVPTRKRQD